eukprot:6203120-Pleurochrysis_carterae.AAC.1
MIRHKVETKSSAPNQPSPSPCLSLAKLLATAPLRRQSRHSPRRAEPAADPSNDARPGALGARPGALGGQANKEA